MWRDKHRPIDGVESVDLTRTLFSSSQQNDSRGFDQIFCCLLISMCINSLCLKIKKKPSMLQSYTKDVGIGRFVVELVCVVGIIVAVVIVVVVVVVANVVWKDVVVEL